MEALALKAFVTLFVVIDPIGTAPIFAALTHGAEAAHRRAMALRGTVLGALILIVFAAFGEPLLTALGVGMPAFRIAGGVLLLLLSIEMVFARHSGVRSPTSREESEARQRDDISVFPLAFPLIAGPGAMTSVVLVVEHTGGDPKTAALLAGVLAAVLVLTLLCLLAAGGISRLLGVTGVNVIGRISGVVLAALAVQFMLDGLKASFGWG